MWDAHLHIWDTEAVGIGWITEAGLPARAEIPQEPAGRRYILVEADADDPAREAGWLIRRARQDVRVHGVIAGIALSTGVALGAGDPAETVRRLAEVPEVVGIRHVLQDRGLLTGAPAQTLRPVLEACAETGLPFDACVRAGELPGLTRLLEGHPELTVVLDHLGKPPMREGHALDRWFEDIAELAALPHLRCKLSGLPAEAADPAQLDRLTPALIDHALAVFGPARCLIGSDAPVSIDPEDWFRRLEEIIPAGGLQQIGEETAELTYRRRR